MRGNAPNQSGRYARKEFLMSNYYLNLLAQAQKLYRHNRQGSYKTRKRYSAATVKTDLAAIRF